MNARTAPTPIRPRWTWLLLSFTRREIFSRYADAYIPRSLLIDSDGRVIAQVTGYNEKDFKSLLKTLAAEMAKLK